MDIPDAAPKAPKPRPDPASALLAQIRAAGLPEPEREFRFHPTRRWRFDLAYPDALIAIEVEGGAFSGGRHSTGAGMTADCHKYNECAIMAWSLLRFTSPMIRDGSALATVKRALAPMLDAMEVS